MHRGLLAWAPILLAACGPDLTIRPKPDDPASNLALIEVEPRRIEFGERTSLDRPVETVTITNVGAAVLSVDEVVLSGPTAYSLLLPPDTLPWDLAPEASATFQVAFAPDASGLLEGTVRVRSTANDEPEVGVELEGLGALSSLEITPDPLDFGDRFVPCHAQQAFTLTNRGSEPLTLEAVELEGDVDQFEVTIGIPVPLTLAKDQSYQVPVRFRAAAEDHFSAQLVVESSDPLSPVRRADVVGAARYAAEKRESFDVPVEVGVNILFAVDQSCSMLDEQQLLVQQFGTFRQILQTAQSNWKIGVVTGSPFCFTGGVITPSTPNWQAAFSAAVIDAPDNAWTEKLLGAIAGHLWNRTTQSVPTCNQGFVSPPGTPLHIVILSDERDQSPEQWSNYLVDYQAFAGANALVRVHSIVDRYYGPCGGPDNGPRGYGDIAVATGGYYLDICSSTWGAAVASIAQSAVQDVSSYAVKDPAVRRNQVTVHPPSVRVWYDGVEQTTGWSWDAAARAIRFDPVPPARTKVDVSYGITPTCP